jgi:hypothetical protein
MLKDTGVKGPVNFCSNKTFAIKRSIKLNKRYKKRMFYDSKKMCHIVVYHKQTIMNNRSIKVNVIRRYCQGSYSLFL